MPKWESKGALWQHMRAAKVVAGCRARGCSNKLACGRHKYCESCAPFATEIAKDVSDKNNYLRKLFASLPEITWKDQTFDGRTFEGETHDGILIALRRFYVLDHLAAKAAGKRFVNVIVHRPHDGIDAHTGEKVRTPAKLKLEVDMKMITTSVAARRKRDEPTQAPTRKPIEPKRRRSSPGGYHQQVSARG